VSDVKLVSGASPAVAAKAYEPRRKKRKRGPETGVIPGSDEEGDESEEDEEGSAGEMYQWGEGVEDSMGAAIKSPILDSQNEQGFAKAGVNSAQEAVN